MSKIYNMSPGFMITYMEYNGKEKLNLQDVFKRLSFELGGDGKTITKDQLDKYIDKADSGLIKVDSNKLKALKSIQKHWDEISQGKDEITFEDMQKYSFLLISTLTGNFEVTEIDDNNTPSSITDAIYDYLTDYLHKSNKDDITKDDLSSYLNELLSSKEDSTSNSELIDAVTNLISSYSSNSTVETEA